MDAIADYCDLCDLPESQCVHGRPPPAPPVKAAPAPKPRKRAVAPTSATRTTSARTTPAPVVEEPVRRRWTPPEAFKPLILTVLQRAGGSLEADEAFAALEALAQDHFLPGDTEATPGGELRWRYHARRARMALIDEGLMTKSRPGVWQVAGPA